MSDRLTGVGRGAGAQTPLRRGLRFRLALTHLAIALLAIVAVGAIVAYTGSRRFDTYLAAGAGHAQRRRRRRPSSRPTSRPTAGTPPPSTRSARWRRSTTSTSPSTAPTAGSSSPCRARIMGPGMLGNGQGHGEAATGPGDAGQGSGRARPPSSPSGHAAQPRPSFAVQRAPIVGGRAAGGDGAEMLRAPGRQGRGRGRLPERADEQPPDRRRRRRRARAHRQPAGEPAHHRTARGAHRRRRRRLRRQSRRARGAARRRRGRGARRRLQRDGRQARPRRAVAPGHDERPLARAAHAARHHRSLGWRRSRTACCRRRRRTCG